MKYFFITFVFICTFFCDYFQITSNPPIINNNIYLNSKAEAVSKSMSASELVNTNTNLLKNFSSKIETESIKKFKSLKEYIYKNKFSVFFGSCLSSYFYFQYKLFSLNRSINSQDSWLSWKNEIGFDKLLLIDQINLANELITDIQKKYFIKCKPDDFITPLMLFMIDINDNINQNEKYLKIIKSINFLKISRIFNITEKTISKSQENLNKLNYLKNILLTFIVNMKQQKLLKDIQKEDKNKN